MLAPQNSADFSSRSALASARSSCLAVTRASATVIAELPSPSPPHPANAAAATKDTATTRPTFCLRASCLLTSLRVGQALRLTGDSRVFGWPVATPDRVVRHHHATSAPTPRASTLSTTSIASSGQTHLR